MNSINCRRCELHWQLDQIAKKVQQDEPNYDKDWFKYPAWAEGERENLIMELEYAPFHDSNCKLGNDEIPF